MHIRLFILEEINNEWWKVEIDKKIICIVLIFMIL